MEVFRLMSSEGSRAGMHNLAECGMFWLRGGMGMVANQHVEALSRRTAEGFDPEQIIPFGSYAYWLPEDYSDVDLLVIMPFAGSPFRKALEIIERAAPPFYVDVVVRTPDDTARRYREHDPLIREALDRGRIVYERDG